jgi:4-hydroxy-2-oxoheptanedioate aldolase
MAQDRFRRDARDGQTLFTAWLTLNSPFLIEVIGRTGWDSILIDQQHGLGGHDEMVACLTAAKAAGVYALVRVADNDFWSVGPSMLAPKASCAL